MDPSIFARGLLLGLSIAAPVGPIGVLCIRRTLMQGWRIGFLTGLGEGRVGLFVRMHHAIADGRAALTLVAAFLDLAPDPPFQPAPEWPPADRPASAMLLADTLWRHVRSVAGVTAILLRPRSTIRRLRAGWPAARELFAEPRGSKTSLDRRVGLDRNLALIRTSLHEVKRIARMHDATSNDVLLAVTAAGLRALLLSRGEPVEGVTTPVYVPVSLRGRMHGRTPGNDIAQMVVPLRLGESDPARRLAQIAGETATRKARRRTSLGSLFRVRFVRRRLLIAIDRQRVNVTTASLPGSSRPESQSSFSGLNPAFGSVPTHSSTLEFNFKNAISVSPPSVPAPTTKVTPSAPTFTAPRRAF